MHNLAILNSNDRDEPIVVGCTGSDNLTVHLVFEDHYTSILGSMHDKRVRAAQEDVVAVAGPTNEVVHRPRNKQKGRAVARRTRLDCTSCATAR